MLAASAPEDGKIVVEVGCTTVAPNRKSKWHPEAKKTGTCFDGCCDDYKCPACGAEWRYENPD